MVHFLQDETTQPLQRALCAVLEGPHTMSSHVCVSASKQQLSPKRHQPPLLRTFIPVSANQRWQSCFVPNVLCKMGMTTKARAVL